MKGDQWATVQKTASSKQPSKPRGKGAQAGPIVPSTELQPEGAIPPRTDLPSNSFAALSTQEESLVISSDAKQQANPH